MKKMKPNKIEKSKVTIHTYKVIETINESSEGLCAIEEVEYEKQTERNKIAKREVYRKW